MGNIGKPSGACATCKLRKIKCDEARPNCSKCQASGRDCPGYQIPRPVRFLDETQKARRRSDQRSKTRLQGSTPASSRSTSSSLSPVARPNVEDSSFEPLQRNLNIVVPEDAAKSYFFNHYLPTPCGHPAGGMYLSSLPRIYAQTCAFSALHYATAAVALAVVARFPDKAYLRELMVSNYGQALRLLAYAVGDVEQAKSNATIMCAMLCVFYESLVNSKRHTKIFRKHHDGISNLLQNRGHSQFSDPHSLGIFRSARCQLVLRGLQHCEGLDDFWFNDEDTKFNDAARYPAAKASLLAAHATRLRERSKDLLTSSFDDTVFGLRASILLTDAYDLDRQTVSSWSQQGLRLSGPYTINLPHHATDGHDASTSTIWNNRLDIYEDLKHASFFNLFRLVRIYIQSVVIRCLARMATSKEQLDADPRYWEALEILQTTVDEICACVPTYVGKNIRLETPDKSIDEEARAKVVKQGFGAYYMMWPLYACSTLELISEEQRAWLKGRLVALTELHGIQVASRLAQSDPCVVWGGKGKGRERWVAGSGGRDSVDGWPSSDSSDAWDTSGADADADGGFFPYTDAESWHAQAQGPAQAFALV